MVRGLIVLPSGRRTYYVQYRNAQRIKKMFKIGIHGQVTTEEVCVFAKKYLSGVMYCGEPTLTSGAIACDLRILILKKAVRRK